MKRLRHALAGNGATSDREAMLWLALARNSAQDMMIFWRVCATIAAEPHEGAD